jgi:hypothetical protein
MNVSCPKPCTFLPLQQYLAGFLILKQHLSGLDRLRRLRAGSLAPTKTITL